MNRWIQRVFLLAGLPALVLACSKPTAAPADAEAKIKVPEMHCSSCVGTIRGGLREVPGIESTTFDLENRVVTVRWVSSQTNQQAIEGAITKAGFKVGAAAPEPPPAP